MGKHIANGPCRAFGIDLHLPLIIMQTREDGNKLFTFQLEFFGKFCDFRHLNFSSKPVVSSPIGVPIASVHSKEQRSIYSANQINEYPPSTTMICPVIYSFFNKNSRAEAISSGRAGRLSGIRFISRCHSSSETISERRTKPGAMAFTRICGARARARIFVRDSSAALLTV